MNGADVANALVEALSGLDGVQLFDYVPAAIGKAPAVVVRPGNPWAEIELVSGLGRASTTWSYAVECFVSVRHPETAYTALAELLQDVVDAIIADSTLGDEAEIVTPDAAAAPDRVVAADAQYLRTVLDITVVTSE